MAREPRILTFGPSRANRARLSLAKPESVSLDDDIRVSGESSVQMPLVENVHVVDQFSPHGLEPALRHTAQPWAVWRDLFAPDAQVLDHGENVVPVLLRGCRRRGGEGQVGLHPICESAGGA